jgi:hypothetical protein
LRADLDALAVILAANPSLPRSIYNQTPNPAARPHLLRSPPPRKSQATPPPRRRDPTPTTQVLSAVDSSQATASAPPRLRSPQHLLGAPPDARDVVLRLRLDGYAVPSALYRRLHLGPGRSILLTRATSDAWAQADTGAAGGPGFRVAGAATPHSSSRAVESSASSAKRL